MLGIECPALQQATQCVRPLGGGLQCQSSGECRVGQLMERARDGRILADAHIVATFYGIGSALQISGRDVPSDEAVEDRAEMRRIQRD